MSVDVPVWLDLTMTVAPMSGSFVVLSKTVPLTIPACSEIDAIARDRNVRIIFWFNIISFSFFGGKVRNDILHDCVLKIELLLNATKSHFTNLQYMIKEPYPISNATNY